MPTDPITTIVVLDTETTDEDPKTGAEICEIAFVRLKRREEWEYDKAYWCYVETSAAFSPVARGTHHIDPAQCRPGAPRCVPRKDVVLALLECEEPGTMLYAAHNASFDMGFLPELQLPAIDTYQVAKHLWPDCPKFSNQTLRYYLGAEPPFDLLEELSPHRALYDAACTAAIVMKAIETHSPSELLRLSSTPILQKTVRFGKYEGKPWSQVPIDYLNWMVRANDMYQNDKDIRYTVDHYLAHRVNQLPI